MQTSMLSFSARALLAASLTWSVGVSAFTPANAPLNLGGQVEPNILFLLDDSGSMRWGYMPDELDSQWSLSGCSTQDYAGVATVACPEGNNRFLLSSVANKIYYNPDIVYQPPLKSDGTRFPAATYTSAYIDGYAQSGTSINLSDNYRGIMDDYFIGWNGGRRGLVIGTGGSPGGARYYAFSASCGSNDIYKNSCYSVVNIGTNATNRQNFSNWFSYYRTRMLVAKSGASQGFFAQGNSIRVGYGTINRGVNTVDGENTGAVTRGVRVFENTGRTGFYDWLKSVQADGSTPLRRALDYAGQYYSRTDARGPWSSTPGSTGGTDYSCRQSYTILTTDGYWNEGDSFEAVNSARRANVDNSNGPTISGPDGKSFQYIPRSPFNDSRGNTLADVAMYYWNRDLHSTLANRVPDSPANSAFWQHMVTFGVGLGVSGSVSQATAEAAVNSGATVTWPTPFGSNPGKIDDLLHASINSRGEFFNAQNPQQFADALSSTLTSIAGRVGSNTAAVPSARRIDSESLVYEATYSSTDWTGQLTAKRPVTTSNGLVFNNVWEAGNLLPPATRKLFTHTGATGVDAGIPLTWAALGTAGLQANFDNTQALFNYLIGTRTGEQPAGSYRARNSLLGDIVNSSIVIANKQNLGFQGITGESAPDYQTFVSAKAAKTPTVFAGSNDGFLHAFNANSGREQFAFMPRAVLPTVKQLADPKYVHKYYVDGKLHLGDAILDGNWRTLLLGGLGAGGKSVFALDVTSAAGFDEDDVLWEVTGDVDLGYTYSEPIIGRLKDGKWVAIFGNGYGTYSGGGALDSVLFIVDLETGTVNKVRAGAATGGLSTPSFVYANDGDGIYVDEIYAGDLGGNLWKFEMSNSGSSADDFKVAFGNASNPAPLYKAVDGSGKAQPITVKPEIAKHPDGSDNGNVIYFGTGSYMTAADGIAPALTDVQTIYGIWDNDITFTGRSSLDAREIIYEGTFGTGDTQRGVRVVDAPEDDGAEGINWDTKKGWYMDLISPLSSKGAQGERVIFSPTILLNRLVVETAIPSTDPCTGGGSGWTMVLDTATGGRLNYVLFDMNQDGKFDEADNVMVDGVPLPISGIGSEDGIPTGSFDLFDNDKYFICRGTGVNACIPTNNNLNIIEGRQSWNQVQ
ncbi:pilus assembly protein [Pseudomonas sp. UBA2684]|uniref:pilus assembly protein n=1 Tax=Pseudomonas sp. UBA2684 TaxID=1947311 RepID=UPI0025E2B98F|nr:PilC/PilY family type IV pilus protein [Pseudomonas sp. UBA2684]